MKTFMYLFLFLVGYSVQGQNNFITKENGKYIYKSQIYKCNELDQALKESEKASLMYKSGRKYKRASTYMFFGGLTVGAIGFSSIEIGNVGNSRRSFSSGSLSGNDVAVAAVIVGAGTAILSIIPRIIGGNKIKSSVDIFNSERALKYELKPETSLSFEETQNGIGFVFQF